MSQTKELTRKLIETGLFNVEHCINVASRVVRYAKKHHRLQEQYTNTGELSLEDNNQYSNYYIHYPFSFLEIQEDTQ